MSPTFVVGIPHADWIPERQRVLTSMLNALGTRYPIRVCTHRVPRFMTSLYSEHVYREMLATGAKHCLFLSDDNSMCPRFWDVLEAMVEAKPDVPIALDSLHPRGKQVAKDGGHWYRCLAWLAGPAMLLPRQLLKDHVEWRDQQTLAYVRDHGDDGALNEWLWLCGIDTWHPVPAPIDHDADMPTAQTGIVERGEKYRRPPVTWRDGYDVAELCKADTWRCEDAPFFHVPSEEERLGIKPYVEG